jgi:hypothetical protein
LARAADVRCRHHYPQRLSKEEEVEEKRENSYQSTIQPATFNREKQKGINKFIL